MVKGELVSDRITASGYREVTTCIGFIIAFIYGKGHFGAHEVTLLANGDWTNAFTHPRIYNTIKSANMRMKQLQANTKVELYTRPYMHLKYTKVK